MDAVGNALNEARKGVAPLACGADVEVDEFVGSIFAIFLAEGNGVAGIAEVDKVDTFYSGAIFYVETRYDTFGKHRQLSVEVDSGNVVEGNATFVDGFSDNHCGD